MRSRAPRPGAAALAGFLLATAATGAIGAWVTLPQIPIWYHGLALPAWTPPDAVFGPAWTALYVLMALAAWLVWRTRSRPARGLGLALWWIQLAANCLWSPVFFGLHWTAVALCDIVLLAVLVAAAIFQFAKSSGLAALLLVPYLAWIGYAASLNAAILVLNR